MTKLNLDKFKNILNEAGIHKYTNNTDILNKLDSIQDKYDNTDIEFLKQMITCLETTNLNKIFNPSKSKPNVINLTFEQLNALFEYEFPAEYIQAKLGKTKSPSFKTVVNKDEVFQNKNFKKYFKDLNVLIERPYTDLDLLNLIKNKIGTLQLAYQGTNKVKFTHPKLKCKSITGSFYATYNFDIYTISLYDLINRYIAIGTEPNLNLNITGEKTFEEGNFETDVITYNGICNMNFIPDNMKHNSDWYLLNEAFEYLIYDQFDETSFDYYVETLNEFIS